MIKRLWLLGAMSLWCATTFPIVAEVLEGPRGPVEFVGLEDWTASDLFKAIKDKDPDRPFRACAAVMIRELNFPDAAAFGFIKQQEDGSMSLYTVVVGVEDSESVKYRTLGTETPDLPDSWQKMQKAAEEEFYSVAAAAYLHYLLAVPETAKQLEDLSPEEVEDSTQEFAEMFGTKTESINMLRTFHDNIDKETDYALALEVVETAEAWSARFVATIVLAQFAENDASWHALAKSVIDPASQVRDVASKILEGLVRAEKTVPVQWTEARETLIALLGGTYPFAFNKILDVLVATEIDSAFARELVQERPKLLLSFVGADHDGFRKSAHKFLTTISSEDFERDVEAWAAWLDAEESDSVSP